MIWTGIKQYVGLWFIFLFVFLFQTKIRGQEVDNQLWLDYNLSVPLSERVTVGGDVGLRGFVSNSKWNQWIIRPTVRYRWNKTFSVAAAVATFKTFNVDFDNVFEFRLHQEGTVNWPDLGAVRLFYRLRIEQRWFAYDNEIFANDFDLRVRNLLGISTKNIPVGSKDDFIYFQVMIEAFKTAGESSYELFINQTRLHAVFGHKLTQAIRYEFHYKWQRSRRYSEDGLQTTQNIFRFRLFHRITPGKNKN